MSLETTNIFEILRWTQQVFSRYRGQCLGWDTTSVFQIQRIVLGFGHNQCFPDTEVNAWGWTQQMFQDTEVNAWGWTQQMFQDTEDNA